VAEIAAALVPRLAAAEREHDLAGRFGGDNLALVADAGLLGLNVPQSFGGLGQTLGGTIEALRILAQGSPSTALMLMMHAGILANYLVDPRHVPHALREDYAEQRAWAFREALAGRIFGVANSETGAGANVKNSKAEVRDGRVYGVKSFCTMGTNADYYMVAARQGSDVEYWLVANDPEHVRVETPWSAMGMRSSESVSLRFDGAKALAPLSYRGLLDGVNNRHWSTLSFAGVFIGIAESLLDEVAAQKSGILQQSGVVDLHLTLQACRSFLRHCVTVEPDPADDSYRKLVRDCKLYVTRVLAQHASSLYIAQSGSSYRFESSVSRKLRDLLAGPAVRPPVGVSFDELWGELSR
jgi:alkylation response protein AidB-like acyl-CoA dehydrogenase